MSQDRKTLTGIEQTGDRRAKVPLVTVASCAFTPSSTMQSSSDECMVSDKLGNYEFKKIGV